MKVLVGCERSGIVRKEFRKLGHDAWSCDVLPSEIPSKYHIEKDVRELLHENWDLGIFFPDCTHICISGARYFSQKTELQQTALDFVARLMVAPIPQIAIENPVGVISSKIRKPDQIIQPWQFGDDAQKKTCLWLKNLPKLKPTKIRSWNFFFAILLVKSAIFDSPKSFLPFLIGVKIFLMLIPIFENNSWYKLL